MSGWVKIHRKIEQWGRYTDDNTFRLFIHCIIKSNHDSKVRQGITIDRGSFITSLEHLGIELNLTLQKIRTSLKKLESTGEILRKTTNKYTLITVVKYCDYNDQDSEYNKQITNQQQTNNKQITTTKEVKNIKNIYTPDFEEFRKHYPHARGGKKKEAYKIRVDSEVDREVIMDEVYLLSQEVVYGIVEAKYTPACERWIGKLEHNHVIFTTRVKSVCLQMIETKQEAKVKKDFGESIKTVSVKDIFKSIRQHESDLFHKKLGDAK